MNTKTLTMSKQLTQAKTRVITTSETSSLAWSRSDVMTLVFGIIASVAALFTLVEFVKPGSTRRLVESIFWKTRTREEEINLEVIGASETRESDNQQVCCESSQHSLLNDISQSSSSNIVSNSSGSSRTSVQTEYYDCE